MGYEVRNVTLSFRLQCLIVFQRLFCADCRLWWEKTMKMPTSSSEWHTRRCPNIARGDKKNWDQSQDQFALRFFFYLTVYTRFFLYFSFPEREDEKRSLLKFQRLVSPLKHWLVFFCDFLCRFFVLAIPHVGSKIRANFGKIFPH